MIENKLTIQQKNAIRDRLLIYCRRYPSRNVAANSLKNVSSATISAILNGKYESVNDKMFLNIAWQVGVSDGWNLQETTVFLETTFALADAQNYRNVHWVVGDAGCGKSTSAKAYMENNRDVYYVLCSEDMRKTDFVREMARRIGIPENGYNIRDVLFLIITTLSERNAPLLVFDEADKLTDSVLSYFITIYNHLEGKVGIVFLSTSFIRRRLQNGLRFNKKGYQEIHSRIGRKFFELSPTRANDVYAVCKINGLSDADTRKVLDDVEKCEYDLRRVKKMVHTIKKANEAKHGKSEIGQ
jgi:DNA transposition AAA+ family ATPase